jgi:hypothetical protein
VFGFVQEFVKTAVYSEGDPHAAWIEAYAADPELRLPAGTWRLTATLYGYLGGDCRGAVLDLSVGVTVVVEP